MTTTNNKIEKNFNKVTDLKNQIKKDKYVEIQPVPIYYNKNIKVYTLIDKKKYFDEFNAVFNFKNFPEWMINFSYIVPIFYPDDKSTVSLISDLPRNMLDPIRFKYYWKKLSDGMSLRFYCKGYFHDAIKDQVASGKITIKMYFYNGSVWHEIFHTKT